jgi:hypothetical protein
LNKRVRLPRWVKRVTLTVGRPLPIYPDQRTSSDRPGMSGWCQERSCARETSDFIFSSTFAISLGKRGNRAGRGQAAEVIDRTDTSGAGTGVPEGVAR